MALTKSKHTLILFLNLFFFFFSFFVLNTSFCIFFMQVRWLYIVLTGQEIFCPSLKEQYLGIVVDHYVRLDGQDQSGGARSLVFWR